MERKCYFRERRVRMFSKIKKGRYAFNAYLPMTFIVNFTRDVRDCVCFSRVRVEQKFCLRGQFRLLFAMRFS